MKCENKVQTFYFSHYFSQSLSLSNFSSCHSFSHSLSPFDLSLSFFLFPLSFCSHALSYHYSLFTTVLPILSLHYCLLTTLSSLLSYQYCPFTTLPSQLSPSLLFLHYSSFTFSPVMGMFTVILVVPKFLSPSNPTLKSKKIMK